MEPLLKFNYRKRSLLSRFFKPHPIDILGSRIVCISDTHGLHRDLDMPDGDILIHAGDFSLHGRESDVHDFNEWLGQLEYDHIIVVNGNHDSIDHFTNSAILLEDSSVTVRGIKIHGCSFNWCMKKGSKSPFFEMIDEDTDIVVSHMPAKGFDNGKIGQGCPVFRQRIREVKPKLVVSGHYHDGRGIYRPGLLSAFRDTIFVNAAVVSDHDTLKRQPIVIDNFYSS